MASYTTINSTLNEGSLQNYSHTAFNEILSTYCKTIVTTTFNMNAINDIQSYLRLETNLHTEHFISLLNAITTFIQQSNLNERFVQTKIFIYEFLSPMIYLNKFDPIFIIDDRHRRYCSTKKPYEYCPIKNILAAPPKGYKPICIQLLARHGSRTLNGNDYDIQTLKIWQLAKQKNMLTLLGEQLKEDIELFMHENNHVGRGELTQLGKEEHYNMGNRLFTRLKSLFTSLNTVYVSTSGKKRAVDSSLEFINGLTTSECNLQILNEEPNRKLLYFHKSCTNYMTFKKQNSHIKNKINTIKYSNQSKLYARNVLNRIYKNEFIELLINGFSQLDYNENDDPIENNTQLNEVDIVLWLYGMFSLAPAQSQSYLIKMLAKYFTQEESMCFAYINDAQEFYEKGPSIEGTTATYNMAKPLLNDFFSSISTCIETNGNISAHLRFAHAETIIPFATLLQIPDLSDKAVHLFDIYTYDNNAWRGDRIAPMAANIQWEIYQNEDNNNQMLVRMLYNETEVRFKRDCKSIEPDSFFYDFNELKRSYARLLLPTTVSNMN